jgi:hypothetical protein
MIVQNYKVVQINYILSNVQFRLYNKSIIQLRKTLRHALLKAY